MTETIWTLWATTKETQVVLNYMAGQRTAKQIIWEYFGLREEAVYDDDWDNIVDYINDFKDLKALERCSVRYTERLKGMWITEEKFMSYFPNGIPNKKEDGEQTNIRKPRTTKKK